MNLRADDLTVRFGHVTALDRVTLELPAGTQALVLGPAGCGKTTLLKCLAGLVRPTSGEIHWNAQDALSLTMTERRDAQAAFGMIFQTDALFDSMSVLENVRLPLRRRGVPTAEATARAREALAQVGLADAAAKSPENLSGGMKKRAGIARAIVARPQVLFADDPFAGLDPVTEGQVASLLLDVSLGRTLIVALPDPTSALPMPLHFRLREGRLQAQKVAA